MSEAQPRVAVIRFPGSNDDRDAALALDELGADARLVWHGEQELPEVSAVVLPGGFSYGDYLRCGAIARFAPVMEAVRAFADAGGLVLGICNGFQVLCEAGLLPGALLRNDVLQFRCTWVHLRTETVRSPFSSACQPGQVLRIPISHGEGNYYADQDVLTALQDEDRIAFRYCDAAGNVNAGANPNGSLLNIAGILSEGRNVLGMMPHPERAAEELTGGTDGLPLWRSLIESFAMSR